MTNMKKNKRHQVKSQFYYIFWGAATVSVLAGQILVGTGFRRMSESLDRIVNTVVIELEEDFKYLNPPHHPMLVR